MVYRLGFILVFVSCAGGNTINTQAVVQTERASLELIPFPQGIPGEKQTLIDIRGYVVRIKNPKFAEFFIPDSEKEPANCSLAKHPFPYCNVVDEGFEGACQEALKRPCTEGQTTCEDLAWVGVEGQTLRHVMRTGKEWSQKYHYQVMIDTNFFDIAAYRIHEYPYKMPCTNIVGPSIANGKILQFQQTDHRYRLFDVFGIGKDGSFVFVKASMNDEWMSKLQYAVAGSLLILDGKPTAKGRKFDKPYNRTSIGRDRQGNLYFISVWGKTKQDGLTLDELVHYTQSQFDMVDLIQLDEGGSTYFHYRGKQGDIESPPFDKRGKDYRPFPTFIGVRNLVEE